jgi:hypothetical protein
MVICMVFLWNYQWIPMGFLWHFGIYMMFLWDFFGNTLGGPLCFFDVSMGLLDYGMSE